MTDEEIHLWARITVLQSFIQDALVAHCRGEPDRGAALDAVKKEIKAQAHRVHLPAHFHGLARDRLSTEVARATDQLIDDIAAQLG
jgi:hypothetical protein